MNDQQFRLTRAVSLACALLNCLAAGDVAIFGLYGPVLQSQLGYTQTQINLISIAVQLGQYLPIPLTGLLLDRYGPRWLNGASCVVLPLAYITGRRLVLGRAAWQFLLIDFGIIGAFNAILYTTAVSTVAKNFEGRRGLAVALATTFYGLSAFWESQIATTFFQSTQPISLPDGQVVSQKEVDMPRLFVFFAFILGISGAIASVGLRVAPDPSHLESDSVATAAEEEPLLESRRRSGMKPDSSISHFLKDSTTWLFFVGLLFIGLGEMYVNSLGTIYQSLLSAVPPVKRSQERSRQVAIFSFTSTASRMVFGYLSDSLASGYKSVRLPRIFLLTGLHFMSVLGCLFLMTGGVQPNGNYFSVTTTLIGVGYGGVHTLLPSMISTIWGTTNLGFFWGCFIYSAAAGGVVFGLAYGSEYDSKAGENNLCIGLKCFHNTFTLGWVSGTLACVIWVIVWIIWRRRGIKA